MAAKKYYAVKKGRETGIFKDWEQCRASVEGYADAEFKGFLRLEDAKGYLGEFPGETVENTRETADPKDRPKEGTLLAYVDGSYDHSLRKYAFGCVFICPDGRVYTKYGNGDNEQSLQQRNVAGEMLGAMYAVRTAMASGFSRVEIRYDYEGIEKWVTGSWRARTELTQKYAASMRSWGKKIAIFFTKVAAHTNVYYNELADKTAKTGLREGNGIPGIIGLEDYGEDEVWHGTNAVE